MAGRTEILDFSSSFTVVGTHLAITSSTVVTATLLTQQEVSYIYKDYTANHFGGSYSAIFNFNVSALSAAANYKDLIVAFTSALGGYTLGNAPPGVLFGLEFAAANSPTVYTFAQNGTASIGIVQGANHSYAVGTTYLATLGYAGFVGQYGAAWTWVYTAGAVPIENMMVLLSGALAKPQYFLPALADNQAISDTISYAVSNGKLYHPDNSRTQETLTGYTQFGSISVWTNNARWNGDSNASAYLFKDFTAGYFTGAYQVSCGLYVNALNGVAGYIPFCILSAADSLASGVDTTVNRYMVECVYQTSTAYKLQLRESNAGAVYRAVTTTVFNTAYPYFVRLSRLNIGTYGTIQLDVAFDEGFTSIIESVTLSLHFGVNMQYLEAILSYASGTSYPGQDVYIGDVVVVKNPPLLASIQLPLQGATPAVSVITYAPQAASISLQLQDAAISVTGRIPIKAAINLTLDDSVLSVTAISNIPVTAAVNLALQGATITVAASTTIPGTIAELISVCAFDKITNQPLAGLTTISMKIREMAAGKLWDFSTNAFSALPVQATIYLSAIDPTHQPELYGTVVNVAAWNGWVSALATYNDGSYTYTWESEESFYVTGIKSTGAGGSGGAAPGTIAAAVGSRSIDGTFTADQYQRLLNAVLLGKVTGSGTGTEKFRNPNDTLDAITATTDAAGNRLTIIFNPN